MIFSKLASFAILLAARRSQSAETRVDVAGGTTQFDAQSRLDDNRAKALIN